MKKRKEITEHTHTLLHIDTIKRATLMPIKMMLMGGDGEKAIK